MGAHVISEKRKRVLDSQPGLLEQKNVYVVGDFSNFEVKEDYKMEKVSDSGLWSIFIEGIEPGEKYKYSIESIHGEHKYKADPYAFESEKRPNTASIISENVKYKWNDRSWMMKRKRFNMYESPINIYEMHLGSWKLKMEIF